MKRCFDVVVSAALLLLLSPVLLLLAVVIKLTAPGPVLYGGERAGRFGRPFRMWKFRSMVVGADARGPSSTAIDDPRITRVGALMRRYKLDELPQLLNVVRGEMSLVGPRPQVLWAVARYSDAEREVLAVRPGITDLASLSFANEAEILKGSADPDRTYYEQIHPEKMRLALEYVRTRTMRLDLWILAATLAVALGLRPAKS